MAEPVHTRSLNVAADTPLKRSGDIKTSGGSGWSDPGAMILESRGEAIGLCGGAKRQAVGRG